MRRLILPFVILLLTVVACTEDRRVMTVAGWINADEMGSTLPHEHVLVDFIGADSVDASRYDRYSAFYRILPFVKEFKIAGGQTMIECTPAYLGRDPVLLKMLSDASGVQIITNTGYYGAAGEKFLPVQVFKETAEELAARWITEWKDGIDGTGIRPGFMKLSADKGPLTEAQQKTIHAAAIAHLETGLTIAVHNGDGVAAQHELSILQEHGVGPEAFIWVHAQNEKDSTVHKAMAQLGVWIEFDGLNDNNVDQYLAYLKYARSEDFLNKVLISHDAGWYHVGEPEGGSYRGYMTLTKLLVPSLLADGFTKDEITLITRTNPSHAFSVVIKKAK